MVIIFGDVSAGIYLSRLGKVACDVPLHAIADNPAFPERTRAPLNYLIFSLIINSAPFYQTLRRQSCKQTFGTAPSSGVSVHTEGSPFGPDAIRSSVEINDYPGLGLLAVVCREKKSTRAHLKLRS
jgi:hypothetical protein